MPCKPLIMTAWQNLTTFYYTADSFKQIDSDVIPNVFYWLPKLYISKLLKLSVILLM